MACHATHWTRWALVGIALREMRGCGHFTLLDWTRLCHVCGEGGLVALCEPSVCSCAFQSVNSARVVYKRAGGGAILRTRRLVPAPFSLSLLSRDRPSHAQHFWRVRRAPSPLRRLRTSNNYNMQLVGRRRTRYAGVLGHLRRERLIRPRLQSTHCTARRLERNI